MEGVKENAKNNTSRIACLFFQNVRTCDVRLYKNYENKSIFLVYLISKAHSLLYMRLKYFWYICV